MSLGTWCCRVAFFALLAVASALASCNQAKPSSSSAASVLEALCAETLAISDGLHLPGGDSDDDVGDDEGDDDVGDDEGDGDGEDDDGDSEFSDDDDDDAGCHAPAAGSRIARLASDSAGKRALAARQILRKGPRFSDAILLAAAAVSADERDAAARPWLAA